MEYIIIGLFIVVAAIVIIKSKSKTNKAVGGGHVTTPRNGNEHENQVN